MTNGANFLMQASRSFSCMSNLSTKVSNILSDLLDFLQQPSLAATGTTNTSRLWKTATCQGRAVKVPCERALLDKHLRRKATHTDGREPTQITAD